MTQLFISSRESILTVFDLITEAGAIYQRGKHVEASFVHLHSITFTHIHFERFDAILDEFLDMLKKDISRLSGWKVKG